MTARTAIALVFLLATASAFAQDDPPPPVFQLYVMLTEMRAGGDRIAYVLGISMAKLNAHVLETKRAKSD